VPAGLGAFRSHHSSSNAVIMSSIAEGVLQITSAECGDAVGAQCLQGQELSAAPKAAAGWQQPWRSCSGCCFLTEYFHTSADQAQR
jgi:hypothetical protein